MRVVERKSKIFLFIISMNILFSPFTLFFLPKTSYASIAHRGASSYAPENTLAAFHRAYELGFDFIELDVRMSLDKELVVIHDPTVDRTTNGSGFVQEMTIDEIKQLDAGTWFDPEFQGERIPLLSEVFAELGGKIGYLIEIKATPAQDELVMKVADFIQDRIREGFDPKNIRVQSFVPKDMQLFSSLCPDIKVGIIIKHPINLFFLANYRHFASFLAVHHQYLSNSLIKTADMLDYEVYIWTIKHKAQLLFVQNYAVHGIITKVKESNGRKTFIARI